MLEVNEMSDKVLKTAEMPETEMQQKKKRKSRIITAVCVSALAAAYIAGVTYVATNTPEDTIKIEKDLTGDGIEDAVLYKNFYNGKSRAYRVFEGQGDGTYRALNLHDSKNILSPYHNKE
jgi:hypothetical protein